MEKLDQIQNQSTAKGNSEDSLLVVYILSILKKYSSPNNHLSSQDVMKYLKEDYSIGDSSKLDAQKKKVRRHLDTLCEFYWGKCIKKEEGKTRNAHKWWYDVSLDAFANENGVSQETLSQVEIEFLIDIVSATKILNSEGTCGVIDKLLKKTSISAEERARRLGKIQKENWLKSSNEDLIEKKEAIESCFYNSYITFDYEEEETITAAPLGWSYDNGVCYLKAKVDNEHRKFSLDKIRICDYDVDEYDDTDDFSDCDEETDSHKTTLDSLFVNIPTIKKAIEDKQCLHFLYRSYTIVNNKIDEKNEEMSVLPHSLVFNDGKYYLIGIDETSPRLDKIVYFRVDLMFELYGTAPKTKLSNWNKHVLETIERAREVEKHPLMLSGADTSVTFKVVESALDRVIDAFAAKPDKFKVTEETRAVKNSFGEAFHDERLVEVQVRTTLEEAFRWALANAEAVELVYPQEVRDRIARISEPVYKLYTHSLPDKVRENLDNVLKTGSFKISSMVDEDTARQTYTELSKREKIEVVNKINIAGVDVYGDIDYIGEFINAERLRLTNSYCNNLSWASNLVNVKTLEFTNAEIDDTSWMKTMKKLKWLFMANSSIDDLSVLSEHKNIDILEISGTNVSDISFIENFQNLTSLSIATCPIEDYSPLFTTKSRLKDLEIDKKALEKIGEEKIRNRHIGIDIKATNNSPFWYL